MKFFRFDWSYLDRLEEIEPGSLDEIRVLLRMVATSNQLDPLGTFFTMALAPFYDRTIGEVLPRLPQLAGNVLYRLADLVPQERRDIIVIWAGNTDWYWSLEDWRKDWVSQYKKGEEAVPHFIGGEPIILPGLDDGR